LQGEKRRQEEKAGVIRAASKGLAAFSLAAINLRCLQDGTGRLLGEQYRTFAGLMEADTANYR
jgi:hypothetical protein